MIIKCLCPVVRGRKFYSELKSLNVYIVLIFSEGKTIYISKMSRKQKKGHWRIRCQRTVKRL